MKRNRAVRIINITPCVMLAEKLRGSSVRDARLVEEMVNEIMELREYVQGLRSALEIYESDPD